MKRLLSLLSLAVLGTMLFAGCDTFERRAHARAATFAALDPAARDKLKKGEIELGNTPDMVYIALGKPDEQTETASPQNKREQTWIYFSYHREFLGEAQTGYQRIVVQDPKTRRFFVYHEPVFSDVYAIDTRENIRIVFQDDKVVAIEQPKKSG